MRAQKRLAKCQDNERGEMATFYQQLIIATLSKCKRTEIDPRHIEGFMRIAHSTLDHLSKTEFVKEVLISVSCVDYAGAEQSESCAVSFGL